MQVNAISTSVEDDRAERSQIAVAASLHDEAPAARLNGRVLSNTLVQFIAPGARLVVGLILVAALARYLGVEGFGAYALVFAYVAAFDGIFGDWGLGTIVLREISRRPEERPSLLASAGALQLIPSAGAYGLMVAGLAVLPFPSAVREGIIVYGLVVFLAPLSLLSLPFQADLRLTKLLAPSLLGVGLHFALTMSVIVLGGPIVALVAAALVARVAADGWVLRLSLRAVRFTARPTAAHWRYFLGESWPLGIGTVISTAIQQAPTLALGTFNLAAVGLFHAALRIPLQLALLPQIIRTTTFPLLARSWVSDRAEFRRMLDRVIAGSLLVAVPLTILGIGLSEPAVRVLFGPGFEGAAIPFAFLLAAIGLLFPGILLGESLTAAGFQRVNLAVLVVAFPCLLALLAVLVPTGGATGAAVAVLGTYLTIVCLTFLGARWRMGDAVPLRAIVPAAVAVLSGGAMLALLTPLGPILSAILASTTSGAVQLVLRPDLARELWRLGRHRAQAYRMPGVSADEDPDGPPTRSSCSDAGNRPQRVMEDGQPQFHASVAACRPIDVGTRGERVTDATPPWTDLTVGDSIRVPSIIGRLPRESERSYIEYQMYDSGEADKPAGSGTEDTATAWRRVQEEYGPFSQAVLDYLLNHEELGMLVRGAVADIGAGSCWLAGKVSRLERVERVFAQDLSLGFLRRVGLPAFLDNGGDSRKLTFVVSDFNDIPLPNHSLDAALMFAALHHSLAPIPTIREILRCLKPTGTLFIYESPAPQLWLERGRRRSERVNQTSEIPTTFNDIRYYLNMAGATDVYWHRLDYSRNAFRRIVRQALRRARVENWLRPPNYLFVASVSSPAVNVRD